MEKIRNRWVNIGAKPVCQALEMGALGIENTISSFTLLTSAMIVAFGTLVVELIWTRLTCFKIRQPVVDKRVQ